jgi:glycosyltransferase involved in cell wall biosynthesis
MIIGIDVSRANRKIKSGTEWYSYYLILELAKIDRKNRYFLYTPEKLRDGLANLPENFEEKILRWPPKRLWTMARLSFEMLISRLDLLFVPAHIIPLVSPKNTVTTIHDVGFLRYPKLYSQKELKYHRFGLRQAVKKARKIITISEFSKRELVDLCKIKPSRIEVIHLGFSPRYKYFCYPEPRCISGRRIPLNNQRDSSADRHRSHNGRLYKDTSYILYTGRLEYKKNTPCLISAFARFKKQNQDLPHKLVLVGSLGVGGGKVLENIKKYNLENEVIMPGWVAEEDLFRIFSRASLFVFPSLYEGFGIPVLEAMASLVPVCASRRAAIPEVAGDAALFFDPENEEEMALAIAEALKNKGLRRELVARGKQRILAFSWEKCAKKTLEILKSCQSIK